MAVKVFISYAHESEILSDAVLELSNYLRAQGIDSEIDQYEESPAEGWPKWMMKQIQDSEYVLVVCSELFYKRANDSSGNDDGLGVKWETSLILQQLYTLNTNNKKYIPVIFKLENKNHIPLPLQPYTYYTVSNIKEKEKLRDRILGISVSKKAPLGGESQHDVSKEALDPKARKSMFLSSIIDIDLWNQAKWKGMAFITDSGLQAPPIVGFVFENEKAGNQIFYDLKKQFGEFDNKDEIRLSFIEDISIENPLDYKVHIGTDWNIIVEKMKKLGLKPDDTMFIGLTRIHEMNPPEGSKNLEVFKHAYSYFKRYYITNIAKKGDQLMPEFNNLIEKQKIHFRKKSEIIGNSNDEDIVVFSSDEDA